MKLLNFGGVTLTVFEFYWLSLVDIIWWKSAVSRLCYDEINSSINSHNTIRNTDIFIYNSDAFWNHTKKSD